MPLSYSEQNGDGATTNFVVPFSYLDRTHVHVYISTVETLAFTWVDSTHVQITPAPPVGVGNVRLGRITPRDTPLADFNNGSVLFDTDLDTAYLQCLFIGQEYFEQPTFVISSAHAIDSHTDSQVGATTAKGSLRIYDNNSKYNSITPPADGGVLIGDTADTKGARWLPKGTDGNFLQVDDAVAGKLSWIPGFKNLLTGLGDILYASAVGVVSRLAIGTAGYVLSATASGPAWEHRGFTTGDVKLTFKTTADAGWVMFDDKTIGDATSGATGRANADTVTLYTLLWNNVSNSWCAVSGGRGASAAADFAAHKTLALSKGLGRALGLAGAGSGLTSRALGEVLGSEDAIVVTHNHTITDPGHVHGGILADAGPAAAGGVAPEYGNPSNTSAATTGITINNAGSSGTGKNMQPTTFLNAMVKL